MMKIVELDVEDLTHEEFLQTNTWRLSLPSFMTRTKASQKEEPLELHQSWLHRNGLLMSVTLGYIVAGFGFTMLGSLLPFMVDRYRTQENDEGMLFLFFYIFGVLFGEVGTLLMVIHFRKQRRLQRGYQDSDDNVRCFQFGLLCSALSLLLLWMCTTAPVGYGLFVLSCIIFGFFLSFIDVSTNAMLSHNSETSAFSLNLLHFGFGVGSFSAPFIFKEVGISATFLVFGFLALIVYLISLAITQYTKPPQMELLPMHQQMETEASSPPAIQEVAFDDTNLFRDFKNLICRFRYWLIILAVLFYAGAELVLGGWIASMFIEMGMADFATTATIVYWMGIMGGRIFFSGYCHIFVSGSLQTLYLLRKYLIFSILTPTLLIVMSPIVPTALSLILVGTVGISFAPILPLLISICGTIFQVEKPSDASRKASSQIDNANQTLISIVGILFCSNTGSGVLPMLTGLVAQRLSIRLAMWVGVACAVMVNLIVHLLCFLHQRKEMQRRVVTSPQR